MDLKVSELSGAVTRLEAEKAVLKGEKGKTTEENNRLKQHLRKVLQAIVYEDNVTAQSLTEYEHLLSTIQDPSDAFTLEISSSAPSSPELKGQSSTFPQEVLIRILDYAFRFKVPIIDPGMPLEQKNMTPAEKQTQPSIPIGLLSVCKLFYEEGSKFLWANELVFTRPTALRQFAQIAGRYATGTEGVTFRIIGLYYDDEAGEEIIDDYSFELRRLRVPTIKRAKSMQAGRCGLQSYCWYQLREFLDALRITTPASEEGSEGDECMVLLHRLATDNVEAPLLFPSLKKLRLDLVNFSTKLPTPGPQFGSLTKSYIGKIVDELLITGLPRSITAIITKMFLSYLVREGGMLGKTDPSYVAKDSGLQPLSEEKVDWSLVRGMRATGESLPGQLVDRYILKEIRWMLDCCPEFEYFDRKTGKAIYTGEDWEDVYEDGGNKKPNLDEKIKLWTEDVDYDDVLDGVYGGSLPAEHGDPDDFKLFDDRGSSFRKCGNCLQPLSQIGAYLKFMRDREKKAAALEDDSAAGSEDESEPGSGSESEANANNDSNANDNSANALVNDAEA